jgi:hypothetical protein
MRTQKFNTNIIKFHQTQSNSPSFTENEGSLLYSQESTTLASMQCCSRENVWGIGQTKVKLFILSSF